MTIVCIKTQHPVDCILDIGNHIIFCSYRYCDNKREGCIEFMNKKSKQIEISFKTTGTLFAAYNNQRLYIANSDSVSIYDQNKLIKNVRMIAICTYIVVNQNLVIVTDVSGCINLFDKDLNFIKCIKISNDTLWICKLIENNLYIGSEEGWPYIYNLKNETIKKIGKKRTGIINFYQNKKELYIMSYDDNVEIFDINTLEIIRVIYKVGSIWNIYKQNNKLYCACMYDGLKVFNENWELIETYTTKSICYGLCIDKDYIYWSSFYESCIFYKQLINL